MNIKQYAPGQSISKRKNQKEDEIYLEKNKNISKTYETCKGTFKRKV